jgi:DNA repair protein RadA/Sms
MKLKVKNDSLDFGTNVLDIEVPDQLRNKVPSGIDFIDAAMGGEGFTPSQVVLFTGTPGAGKTTMLLKLADSLTKQGAVAVFNTAEESLFQVKIVAERLNLKSGFAVGQETHIPTLLQKCDALRKRNPGKPFFLLIDSLQCMDDGKYADGGGGTKTAERALEQVTNWCKENFANAIVIGQVNKAGKMAGTQKLKHVIDTMLELSVEEKDEELLGCRILKNTKNRFGSSGTQIWLEVKRDGFNEVARLGVK